MRLNREQLNLIQEKMGVDKLWSYSKVGTFDQCTWLYKLKYIDKIRVKGDNCWTWWGSASHEIMQDWYDKKFNEYIEMAGVLEKKVIEYSLIADKKYHFPDDNQWKNYIANIRHYFANTEIIPFNVINERAVLAVFQGIEKYVFQGYLDSEFVDAEGNLVIMDYKTSSISGFTGQDLIKKARQLIIYAIGVSQHGRMIDGEMRQFPIDKIKVRYDMMKYVNVTFMQKNGNIKVTKAERRNWVGHMATQLRKDLEDIPKDIEKCEKEIKKLERKYNAKVRTEDEKRELEPLIKEQYDRQAYLENYVFDEEKVAELIEQACTSNELTCMPPFIQEKYTVGNCYIDVELTPEVIEECRTELVATLDQITLKSKKGVDTEEAFDRSRIENSDSYYCVNLCDMKDHCKHYKEFKQHNEMFLMEKKPPSDQELLSLLGLG
ncbi:PD-(D/E)XK nuclease family protein [Priestia megaterium]|uniref:PD-(D/E)XK nuclease family protein n=1 Tax=Priestia megaterium TaxID=1404 RepID=UPI002FFF1516